jgi:hypothetical protein
MEKFNKIPNNRVLDVKTEAFMDSDMLHYGGSFLDSYGKEQYIEPRIRVNIQISIIINKPGDFDFVNNLASEGLEYVANMGFDIQKFKFIINEGMQRLPILLKHNDPDIAKMAWVLSKYFSQRNDIMPEKVIE